MPPILFTSQLETVARQYEAFLKQNVEEALSLVEAYWEAPPPEHGVASDPLVLPRPEEWLVMELADDLDITQFVQRYPAVLIEASGVQASGQPTLGTVPLQVFAYVADSNAAIVAKQAHRYATALASIMWADKPHTVAAATNLRIDIGPVFTSSAYLFRPVRLSQDLLVSAMVR